MKDNGPNIILIMCDDLGYGDTGFNGTKIIRTPNLDLLRAKGARFTYYRFPVDRTDLAART